MRRLIQCLSLVAAFAFGASAAQAHPQSGIVAKSELVYAPDGTITGVRHAWTFDDMFSTYALQGIETKTKGVYTRDELKPLAQTNVESLKEYAFFTFAKIGPKGSQKKEKFTDPVDYYLDYKDSALTLHFTLPFKTPFKADTLAVEVFDPSYFIDFQLNEKDPVTLVGAPASCKLTVERPSDGRRAGADDERADLPQRRQFQLRRDVRQQDQCELRSMTPVRPIFRVAPICLAVLAAMLVLDSAVHAAYAQNPFGAPKGAVPDSQVGGIVGWLLAKQSEFYRQMSATIRAAKTDGSAVWALLGISFAYGIFHAAGPGHGKAV